MYYGSTIQMGSRGNDTKRWQEYLNTQGYELIVDGEFGEKTDSATKDYQSKNGLTSDGIVGEKTWGKAGYALSPDIALNQHLANKPGEYKSQWTKQLDSLMNQIMNRKFSYDINADALYQQYKDKSIQQGELAMEDTIGQAAAMTGGYANSYAQTVGQNAYKAQLDNLNNVIPELYQLAFDMYNQESQALYNKYAMIRDKEDIDYEKYRQNASDYLAQRDYLAQQYNEYALKVNNDSDVISKIINTTNNYTTKQGQADYLAKQVEAGRITQDQAFAILDEHGVVGLTDRSWEKVDDGGINWFWGVDNDAVVRDENGNEYTLKELKKELQKTMNNKEANNYIKELQDKLGI